MCRRLQACSVAGASVTCSGTSGIVNTHKCQRYTYNAYLVFSVGVLTEDEGNAGDPYMKSKHEECLSVSEVISVDCKFDTKTG